MYTLHLNFSLSYYVYHLSSQVINILHHSLLMTTRYLYTLIYFSSFFLKYAFLNLSTTFLLGSKEPQICFVLKWCSFSYVSLYNTSFAHCELRVNRVRTPDVKKVYSIKTLSLIHLNIIRLFKSVQMKSGLINKIRLWFASYNIYIWLTICTGQKGLRLPTKVTSHIFCEWHTSCCPLFFL